MHAENSVKVGEQYCPECGLTLKPDEWHKDPRDCASALVVANDTLQDEIERLKAAIEVASRGCRERNKMQMDYIQLSGRFEEKDKELQAAREATEAARNLIDKFKPRVLTALAAISGVVLPIVATEPVAALRELAFSLPDPTPEEDDDDYDPDY